MGYSLKEGNTITNAFQKAMNRIVNQKNMGRQSQ